MKKEKIFGILVIILLFTVFFTPLINAEAKTVDLDFSDAGGRVTDITSKKLIYRTQTGSSPESWAKPKKLKITSSTKFYKCKGYTKDYDKFKLKKVKKSKAISEIYNNGSNYVFFNIDGKNVTRVVYGMENFVG